MHNEPQYRPWGVPTAGFWQTAAAIEAGSSSAPPDRSSESVRKRLMHVATAAAGGDLDGAAALAREIDEDATTEFGEAHRQTIEAREVRGYLAALMGDLSRALDWYLHSVRLRAAVQGPGHPDTLDAAQRAYGLWRAIPASPEAQRLGIELLTTATDVHGPDSDVARRTHSRLYHLVQPSVSA
ncbi:hypothetical protein AB0C77_13695 [Streptomyces sp. NPDC048629]|uniref:hypothetical protein n=1 Tax=Streptomyces sp. NPDC048629 TaxID=3154824 RepID=UPI0034492751